MKRLMMEVLPTDLSPRNTTLIFWVSSIMLVYKSIEAMIIFCELPKWGVTDINVLNQYSRNIWINQ